MPGRRRATREGREAWVTALTLSGVIVMAAVVARVVYATRLMHAGHGDMAFYFGAAKKLAEGAGARADHVMFYLAGVPQLPTYAFDYWMPLASLLMALPMLVVATVQAALVPVVVANVAVLVLTFVLAMRAGLSLASAMVATAWMATLPDFAAFAVMPETPSFHALFSMLAFVFAQPRDGDGADGGDGDEATEATGRKEAGRAEAGRAALAGAMAGLCHLTRNDGVLVLVVVLVTTWLMGARGSRLRRVLFAGAAYGAVMLPLVVMHMAYLGRPWPATTLPTLFLTRYVDLFGAPDAQRFFAQPLTVMIETRARLFAWNVKSVGLGCGVFAVVGAIVAAWLWVAGRARGDEPATRAMRTALPAFGYLALLMLVYSVVLPILAEQGSFYRSMQGVAPFVVVAGVAGVEALCVRLLPAARASLVMTLAGLVVAAWGLFATVQALDARVRFSNDYGEGFVAVRRVLDKLGVEREGESEGVGEGTADGSGRKTVVMAAWPIDAALYTGLFAVQAPDAGEDEVYARARHYEARYLLLPSKRAALERLYEGATSRYFVHVADVPGTRYRIYRVRAEPAP